MLRLPAVVPQEAIQHGKETAKYLRYHHPEVTLKDRLDQAKAINQYTIKQTFY